MLRRSYTSAAAAHTHGRPRRETRDPRRCNGHPRPLPGAARRAAPLSANACPIPLVARARLPQAACCTVQGVGHDVSPCSGLPGAALGSGGAWRGARLLPGPSVRTRVGPLTQADAAVLKTTDEKVERAPTFFPQKTLHVGRVRVLPVLEKKKDAKATPPHSGVSTLACAARVKSVGLGLEAGAR